MSSRTSPRMVSIEQLAALQASTLSQAVVDINNQIGRINRTLARDLMAIFGIRAGRTMTMTTTTSHSGYGKYQTSYSDSVTNRQCRATIGQIIHQYVERGIIRPFKGI